MKFQEHLPLPLSKICEDLEAIGLEPMVYRAGVEYDERACGTDVTLKLEIRIKDIRNERDTNEKAFNRAMGIIE